MFSKKRNYIILILSVVLLAVFLRLFPGKDSIIWFYDQARDRKIMLSLVYEHDLILRGPSTSKWGLFHGPLYYYVLAPFYFLSGGEPTTWPLITMIAINVSSLIPIWLLTKKLPHSKVWFFFFACLFAVSYEQIEYARWLTNVSLAVPLLSWVLYSTTYYFLEKKNLYLLLAGLFLGAAIQAEVLLLYLIPLIPLLVITEKLSFGKKILPTVTYLLGLLISTSPFFLAELKFNFLATKSLLATITSGEVVGSSFLSNVQLYLKQVSLVAKLNLFGVNQWLSLTLLVALLISAALLFKKKHTKSEGILSKVALAFFAFHFLLFMSNGVDRIYMNLGIDVLVLLIMSFVLTRIYFYKKELAFVLIGVITFLNIQQLYTNTKNLTPFGPEISDKPAYLLSSYLKVYELMYSVSNNQQFSFAALANPYGVQDQWADILDIYLHRNPELPKPTWFGYHANGYLYDDYITKLDYPQQQHFVIKYPQRAGFLPEPIFDQYFAIQNGSTTEVGQIKIDDITLEIRERKDSVIVP